MSQIERLELTLYIDGTTRGRMYNTLDALSIDLPEETRSIIASIYFSPQERPRMNITKVGPVKDCAFRGFLQEQGLEVTRAALSSYYIESGLKVTIMVDGLEGGRNLQSFLQDKANVRGMAEAAEKGLASIVNKKEGLMSKSIRRSLRHPETGELLSRLKKGNEPMQR